MIKRQHISDAEKLIMQIIWETEGPVTTYEILARLPEDKTSWKKTTVLTFLSRLVEKGFIKSTRIGKANQYEACISEQEYRKYETKEFVKDIHNGSVLGLISTLCKSGDLTKEDIESVIKTIMEEEKK